MTDKGRPSVEQRIKTVLFFTETRSVAVTQGRCRAHFQTQWAPSFTMIHKLYHQFNNNGSVLVWKRRQPEDMCRRVISNIIVRVEEVVRRNGGHIGFTGDSHPVLDKKFSVVYGTNQ
jgi:hypothetical protein